MTDKEERKNALADFAKKLEGIEQSAKEEKRSILKEGIKTREKQLEKGTLKSRKVTSSLASIREKAGMSAFVGTGGEIVSPRFKRKEFLRLLARELLYIATEELSDSGGIFSLNKIENYFAETRSNWKLRDKDILEAVQQLEKEKLIPGFMDKEKGIVQFKPVELSDDTTHILRMASGLGQSSVEALAELLGWDIPRVEAAIKVLVKLGLAIEDSGTIFFPGL